MTASFGTQPSGAVPTMLGAAPHSKKDQEQVEKEQSPAIQPSSSSSSSSSIGSAPPKRASNQNVVNDKLVESNRGWFNIKKHLTKAVANSDYDRVNYYLDAAFDAGIHTSPAIKSMSR